jgi:hypothetical protein
MNFKNKAYDKSAWTNHLKPRTGNILLKKQLTLRTIKEIMPWKGYGTNLPQTIHDTELACA